SSTCPNARAAPPLRPRAMPPTRASRRRAPLAALPFSRTPHPRFPRPTARARKSRAAFTRESAACRPARLSQVAGARNHPASPSPIRQRPCARKSGRDPFTQGSGVPVQASPAPPFAQAAGPAAPPLGASWPADRVVAAGGASSASRRRSGGFV
ncbi:hypothetical protein B0H15DRAFT_810567, partial [Mycena belliarum]